MSFLGSSKEECEAIFDKFKMEREDRGQVEYFFMYRDVLLSNYAKPEIQPVLKRSKTMISTVTRIKKEILKFLRLKNYTVSEFFHILKSKKSDEISLADFVSACQHQVTNLSQ